jgi:hypothetical protein
MKSSIVSSSVQAFTDEAFSKLKAPHQSISTRLHYKSRQNNRTSLSQKDRQYLERSLRYMKAPDEFSLLRDGEAYPNNYDSSSIYTDGKASLRWGRILRSQEQSVTFEHAAGETVIAHMVSTVEGTMKIAGPFYLSKRKRFGILHKPFRETYSRKAFFKRIAQSREVSKNWMWTGSSFGCGGSESPAIRIERAIIRSNTNEILEVVSPLEHMIVARTEHDHSSLREEMRMSLELQIASQEMEPSIVVVRCSTKTNTLTRTQLLLRSDRRETFEFQQTYEGMIDLPLEGASRGPILVEAVLRSTLYEPGTPVVSHCWVIPV